MSGFTFNPSSSGRRPVTNSFGQQKPFAQKPLAFVVDDRVRIELDYDLACRLGQLILNARIEDDQLLALGHRLMRDAAEE